MAAMEYIRKINPFPVEAGDPSTLAPMNKGHITKGVVKVGWSWENRFVMAFEGVKQLEGRLKELLTTPGCMSSECIVQEWVDFDFEMRVYFLPPGQWAPGKRIEPVRFECNEWGKRDEKGAAGTSRAPFR